MLFDPDVVHQLQRRRGAQRWVFRTHPDGKVWPGRLQMAKAKIERVSIGTSPLENSNKKTGAA